MSKSRKIQATIWLVVIALVIITLDQYTKSLVRANLTAYVDYMPIAWLDRFVTLTYVQNTGAAFGLFQGGSIVLAIVAVVVVGFIVVFFRQQKEIPAIMVISLGLMLAGSTGNLIDRIARGFVTDFVNLRWWPVFNVADSSIVIGTILLAVYILFLAPPEEHETKQVAAENETMPHDDLGSSDA